jgi:Tol biopolymer transport system component
MAILSPGGALHAVLENLPDVFWTRFMPDGKRLLFDAKLGGGARVGVVGTDGAGLRWLTEQGADCAYADPSPDGAAIAFVRTRDGRGDVVVRTLADGAERVLASNGTLPRFSPDGRTIAFARSRSFTGGVWVVPAAGGEPRRLTESGSWPAWLPDGRAVAYADVGPEGTQRAYRVPLAGGDPQPLGERRWRSIHYPFAISRAGDLITTDEGGARSTLWLAER